MSNLKPGDNIGTNGGIYQEVDQHVDSFIVKERSCAIKGCILNRFTLFLSILFMNWNAIAS